MSASSPPSGSFLNQFLVAQVDGFTQANPGRLEEYGASYLKVFQAATGALERFLRTEGKSEEELAQDPALQQDAAERVSLMLRSTYPNASQLAGALLDKERGTSPPAAPPAARPGGHLRLVAPTPARPKR